FNIYLDTTDVTIAKDIAKRIRASGGGLPAVQASGFEVEGKAQVSMNLLDIDTTSPATVFAAVESAAGQRGVGILKSEVVGLIPERAQLRRLADDDAAAYTKVSAAYRLPKSDPRRTRAADEALIGAAQTPLAMARGAARLLALANEIGTIGNRNAHSDAKVGEALARAALAGAVENVRVNVASLSEPGLGQSLLEEANRLESAVSRPS